MAQPQQTFPLLKLSETVHCLQEMNIHVTAADLKDPQSAVIRNVYETFMSIVMDVRPDEFRQPEFAAISFLEYPELHEESISNIAFLQALTRLMTASGFHSFTLRDVIHPDPPRTLQALSALINFSKFRQDQNTKYQRLVMETDHLNVAKQREEDENATLHEQIRKIKQSREREQPQVDALLAEANQFAVEITELNKTQAACKANARNLKDETTGLVDEIASIALQAQTIEQENLRLKSKIVQSPERMKRDMAELAQSLERERENAIAMERKAQSLAIAAQTADTCQQEVVRTMKMIDELGQGLTRRKQAEQALECAREGLQTATKHLQELTNQEQQIQHQVALAQQRQHRLAQKQEMKRVAASQAMDELRKEHANVEEEAKQARARTAKIDAVRNEQRQKQLRMKQAHEMEMNTMRGELKTLKDQSQS